VTAVTFGRLERAELLTPIPRAEVLGRQADGQRIEYIAETEAEAWVGLGTPHLVEPIVLSVKDLGRA
jgi:hypothetical protein